MSDASIENFFCLSQKNRPLNFQGKFLFESFISQTLKFSNISGSSEMDWTDPYCLFWLFMNLIFFIQKRNQFVEIFCLSLILQNSNKHSSPQQNSRLYILKQKILKALDNYLQTQWIKDATFSISTIKEKKLYTRKLFFQWNLYSI